MAFLRNGLATARGNRREIPSRYTKPISTKFDPVDPSKPIDEPQPKNLIVQAVKEVIKMSLDPKKHHKVRLQCGHVVESRSLFQGYCTECDYDPQQNNRRMSEYAR